MLDIAHLDKTYQGPTGALAVLRDVSFTLDAGSSAAIMGPSGSGKSTLLYVIGTLEPPTSGTVMLDGQNPFTLDPAAQAAFRNRTMGFIFQDHCLLPQCSVIENVLIPTLVGPADRHARAHAEELLVRVGLGERLLHRPAALSGGERQRVAIARALINRPKLLLCDEPTGNLDRRTADEVAALLGELTDAHTVLVVVTHSHDLARRFTRRFEITDGHLLEVS